MKKEKGRSSSPCDGADVVIVLGARFHTTDCTTINRRVQHGITVFKESKAEWILLCGGFTHDNVSEAELMAKIAMDSGIPKRHIVIENRSTSTWENAEFAAPIIKNAGWKRACLVSDGIHLLRAWLVFRHTTLEKICLSSASTGQPISSPSIYAHEIIGMCWYLVRFLFRR